jgi:hypothetical protein
MQTSFRTQRFGRGATILRARGSEPLALDQIEAQAPAVFAAAAHESRSARYTYIPTREVLTGLWNEGFRPFEVRQGGTEDEGRRGFAKHMIRLRRSGAAPVHVGDAAHEEVVISNAHDGTGSWQLFAGLWRLICSNGLIVADSIVECIRIQHRGNVVHEVIEGAYRIAASLPAVVESARQMGAVRLSSREQLAFARAAAELRWEPRAETPALPAGPIAPERLLDTRRNADQGSDLWRTFNRVQEGLLQGGQRYDQVDGEGRVIARRRVRPVNGIDQNRQLNRALWTLAEEMRRIKSDEQAAAA